jgi:ribonuclease HI
MKTSRSQKTVIVYVDGSGQRPDGKGSGIAWFRVDTDGRRTKKIDGLTNNEAEYRAVIDAVENLDSGSLAEILSDSELVCCQFNGKWKVSDPALFELLSKLRDLIKRKRLRITLTWIPRRNNLAGKMI